MAKKKLAKKTSNPFYQEVGRPLLDVKDAIRKVESGTAPEVRPTVVGVRYCMDCGKSCLSVGMPNNSVLPLANVGRALSTCCGAFTMLLLVPTTAEYRPVFSARLVPVANTPSRPE